VAWEPTKSAKRPALRDDPNVRVRSPVQNRRENLQSPSHVLAVREHREADPDRVGHLAPDGEGFWTGDQNASLLCARDALVGPEGVGHVDSDVERPTVSVDTMVAEDLPHDRVSRVELLELASCEALAGLAGARGER